MFDTTHYHDIATTAASWERQGQFERAASLWGKAHVLARHKNNQEWSLARKAFCRSHYVTGLESRERVSAAA